MVNLYGELDYLESLDYIPLGISVRVFQGKDGKITLNMSHTIP